MNFSELGLKQPLLDALEILKFETPTPIQEQAIPVLLGGQNDFIGLAQTGTGKTGAFGLPMLDLIDPGDRRTQGIIVCPTRELCMQVAKDLVSYASRLKSIRITPVYGGAGIVEQIHELQKGSQVVVATPGRLCDLIRRNGVDLSAVRYAVLDEADEMLHMGFKEDIDAILQTIARNAKIWLFSATMPREVAAMASKFLSNPLEVTVGGRNRGAENIVHQYYVMREKDRYQALRRLLDANPDMFSLVFCRTRCDTREVAEKLIHHGHPAEAIHGDLSQSQRDMVMGKFRAKNIRILVATDVAARGLDIDDISHVIHYTLPDDPLVYTHRSGRTARAGKSGHSMVLISPRERFRIRGLEHLSKIRFDLCRIPTGETICRNQVHTFMENRIKAQTDCETMKKRLPQVYDAFEGLSKQELIDLIVSREFGRLLSAYHNAPDIDADGPPYPPRNEYGPKRQGANPKRSLSGFSKREMEKKHRDSRPSQRFFISIGELDKVSKSAIVRLVCDKANIQSQMIGGIDVRREFSFFDVDDLAAERVRKSMKNVKFDGKLITVQPSNSPVQKQAMKSRRAS